MPKTTASPRILYTSFQNPANTSLPKALSVIRYDPDMECFTLTTSADSIWGPWDQVRFQSVRVYLHLVLLMGTIVFGTHQETGVLRSLRLRPSFNFNSGIPRWCSHQQIEPHNPRAVLRRESMVDTWCGQSDRNTFKHPTHQCHTWFHDR